MCIEEKLAQFIRENGLFTAEDRLLLGVSGGKDSMLMTVLLHRLGYKLVIAHCNFQLRGEESDKDEALVRQTAAQMGIPFFVKRFDTKSNAEAHRISIQMSARALRYAWFEELRQEQSCQAIAIAQHQQDNIETVCINLVRGTGLQGLQGILPNRGNIVRPLLFMTTEEIAQAAQAYEVPYRDDQSNFSTKYARNKIRLDVLPILREIKPDFDQVMADNIRRFTDAYQLLQQFMTGLRQQIFTQQGEQVLIRKDKLAPHLHNSTLLYELFQPYGFSESVLGDLVQSWNNGSGLRFGSSGDYTLLMDREALYLQKKTIQEMLDICIEEHSETVHIGYKELHISPSESTSISPDPNTAQVDADTLMYPLQVRYWQEGDRFVPLGMTAPKKLSDFFIANKFPVFEKSRTPLLVNGNGEIIWIIGHRLDNRYKISEITKKVVTFVYG